MLKKNSLSTSDFKEIIDNNYAYVDKTRFLEVYENHGYPVSMLLRPRRFGKTMFAELLRYYYDISLKDEGGQTVLPYLHRFSPHSSEKLLSRA